MTSLSRNAPCPCGSGKKYKLCCLPREGTSAAQRPTPREEAQTIRTAAFAKLVTFGGQPVYKDAIEAAFQTIWSPAFRRRVQRERDEAFASSEAVGGMITYFMLDAPATLGATIAEQYLGQLGATLPRADYDYLTRLASTRMGLYHIVEVRTDTGLTVIDLWSNDMLEIRERRLTHYVAPNDVVAARVFPAIDHVNEFDGAVYKFTLVDALKVIKSLSTPWRAALKSDPHVNEQLFLKRRLPVAINRYYFNHIFFRNRSDDQYPRREAIEVDPDTTTIVTRAVPGRSSRRAANSMRKNYTPADRRFQRLANFLHSSAASTAMSIDKLHGFLTALVCGPAFETPSTWLTLLWGETEPAFESEAEAERILDDILEMFEAIGLSIIDGTFTPVIRIRASAGVANIAQVWCLGFLSGMAVNERSWDPLIIDESARGALMPIFALASPQDCMRDPDPHGKATSDSIEILKFVVPNIADYWHRPPQQTQQMRKGKKSSTRAAAKILPETRRRRPAGAKRLIRSANQSDGPISLEGHVERIAATHLAAP